MSTLAEAFRSECGGGEWTSIDLDGWLSDRIDPTLEDLLGCSRLQLAALLGRTADAGRVTPSTDAGGVIEHCIAAACRDGSTAAIQHFRRAYLLPLRPVLASYGLDDSAVDDVLAKLLDRLLIVQDDTCKLVGYAGRGRLRGLVKVAATRLALDEVRRRKRHPVAASDDLSALSDPERDPELAYLKSTYRAHFREAFAVASQALDARSRNLLRMHLIHGVTLEKLATGYSVHRATIVRWLARAREHLLAETEKEMRTRLGVSGSELKSVMGLIGSRLDASVSRLLDTQ